MGRLPFNPDHLPRRNVGRPARRERARLGADPAASALSVTQVTLLIKDTLADHTPAPLTVVGEISNFSERGHWYLSLKDEQNVLNCVMWQSAAAKVGFAPDRGMKVLAAGRLDYYGPQARLQMYIDKLEPVGQGELELRFRRLCDELRQLGYFAAERQRPLPAFPQHVAVITSAKGAAVQDVIRTARQRWAGVRLSIVDVQVQGEAAAPDIARAVDAVSTHHGALGIDALVLTRGGGSLEDLWAFNERIVADAVFACAVPVVAAIGHEVDTTVAELVADLRCSTPTQAAERLVPDARAEHQHLHQVGQRLRTALRRRAEIGRSRLDAARRHELFRRPADRLADARREAGLRADRLARALRDRLRDGRAALTDRAERLGRVSPGVRVQLGRQRLAAMAGQLRSLIRHEQQQAAAAVRALARQLQSVGPRSVLQRGYSYTTDASRRLIRRVSDVGPGDRVTTHLGDGTFDSTVAGQGTPPPAEAAPRRRRRRATGGGEGSLFG